MIQWSLYRWKSVCVWLVVDIFCVITLRYTWTIVEVLLDCDGGSNVASVGEDDIVVHSASCGEPCRVRLSIRKLAYVCCGGLFNLGAFLCWFEEEEGDGGKGFLHISSHSLLYLILTSRRLANRVLLLRPCVKSQAIIVCSFRYCLILLGFVCCLT